MTPLPAVDFLAQLPEPDRKRLLNALESGLSDVRMADRCLAAPRPRQSSVRHLHNYLRHAIDRLEVARDVVRRLA